MHKVVIIVLAHSSDLENITRPNMEPFDDFSSVHLPNYLTGLEIRTQHRLVTKPCVIQTFEMSFFNQHENNCFLLAQKIMKKKLIGADEHLF